MAETKAKAGKQASATRPPLHIPTQINIQDNSAVPLLFRRRLAVCAAIISAMSLALFAWTLAPTVTLVDSGELIIAARTLGVAHPPGFPLYLLLAGAATLAPFGNIAARVNFASAVFAAVAAGVMVLLVAEMMLTSRLVALLERKAEKKAGKNKKARKPTDVAATDAAQDERFNVVLLCASASGLLLTCSRTLWSYATIAEVYTLNTLLILIIFFLSFRWRLRIIESRAGRTTAGDKSLYAAAFVFGLALGVHHVTVGLMLPALAALVYRTEGLSFFKSKRFIRAMLFALAGLAIYLYLPLAASRSPLMNWGDPRTFERLWWHVSGRQYQVFFSFSPDTMLKLAGEFLTLTAREFGPAYFPATILLAVAGMIFLFKRDTSAVIFLLLVVACDLAYALNYEIAEDKDAYYLPVIISIVIAAGFGAQWLLEKARRVRLRAKLAAAIVEAFILSVPLVALAANLPYNNRSQFYVARDYVENILSTIEPGGLLLTPDWQVYSPLLYAREIESERRDVVAIDVNLLRRSWYFDYLSRSYPSLIEQSREKVDAFLADLKAWEQDPEAYARDTALNQRINTRFYDMILAFVREHIKSGSVYVTLDIAVNRDGQDSELTRSLSSAYQFVPHGLVFKLIPDREYHEPAAVELKTRGLADGSIRYEPEDVVMKKVLPVYLNMMVNRGRYQGAHGRYQQAIESFEQALAIDPSFKTAQQSLREAQNALRNTKPQ